MGGQFPAPIRRIAVQGQADLLEIGHAARVRGQVARAALVEEHDQDPDGDKAHRHVHLGTGKAAPGH